MGNETTDKLRRYLMKAFFYLLFGVIFSGILLLWEKGVVWFGWEPLTWSGLTWLFVALFIGFWTIAIHLGMDYVIEKWNKRWETKLDEERVKTLEKLAKLEARLKEGKK